MMSTIFIDEPAIKTMESGIGMMVEKASKLAAVWNRQSIMGAMTKRDFALLLSGGVPFFMAAFHEAIRRDEARQKGEAYYHLVDVTKYAPIPMDGDVNFDTAKLSRMIESANHSRHNWSYIDFDKSGLPYISKATKEWIKDIHTIYGTAENMAALEAGEADAEALNLMIDKGHEIKAGRPFEMHGGRYAFDPKTLSYGSGVKPPKAVDAVYEPPEVPDDGTLSPYQPVDANKVVRRRAS